METQLYLMNKSQLGGFKPTNKSFYQAAEGRLTLAGTKIHPKNAKKLSKVELDNSIESRVFKKSESSTDCLRTKLEVLRRDNEDKMKKIWRKNQERATADSSKGCLVVASNAPGKGRKRSRRLLSLPEKAEKGGSGFWGQDERERPLARFWGFGPGWGECWLVSEAEEEYWGVF